MPRKSSRRAAPSATAENTRDRKLPRTMLHAGAPATTAFPIVGIGASAGGLEAFGELLRHLPLDTGMGFVLVQHLDPQHESALPQLLARATSLPVLAVTDNLRVIPNHVYVIPPNTSLEIARGVLRLKPRPQRRMPARSIDGFFESLAEDQRERAIGVILSGTASDGTVGLEAIKAEGGITFAQDESARYDSMPRSAEAAGCVDFVLSPEGIAGELTRIAAHPYVVGDAGVPSTPEEDHAHATEHEDDATPLPSGGHGTPPIEANEARAEAGRATGDGAGAQSVASGFKKILLLLRNHSGVDFTLYKSSTIQRRVARRVILGKQTDLESYAQFLRGNTRELDALYTDVLISVTSFFRNPEAFDVLKRRVFPKLMQQRGDEPLRVWVLGCSTGQEAYSIAMAFTEAAEKAPRMRRLQVFATDLNDTLLDKARHGLYAKSLAEDLAPERLRRFFVEEEGGYRVVKALREMVVFAKQNLTVDPPFSRMDLVSCRNLLIYLEPSLQKKVLPVFHYALKPDGFLFLGSSESVGTFTDLFEPVDKKYRIYARKAGQTPAFRLPVRKVRGERPSRPAVPYTVGRPDAQDGFRGDLVAQREADRVAVNQFAPPSVLVNAELQILQFRGPTDAYLKPPTGKASFDVLKMAREGLMLPLRALLNKARKDNQTARKANVRVEVNGASRTVDVEVIPLKNLRDRCYLIVFDDTQRAGRGDGKTPAPASPPGRGTKAAAKEETRRLVELESALVETRDYLQSLQEQHEAANEELQASNEEVQSANEELQSLNEELETSKEELESTNEELSTVNDEMANRNAELNRANSDLVNLQTSTRMAIVLLGRDLTIRRFSAQAEKQFNLVATDVGRRIGGVRHNLLFASDDDVVPGTGSERESSAAQRATQRAPRGAKAQPPAVDLEGFIAEVIDSVREDEREVQDRHGHWYQLRVRPYLTIDNKVDGAVLVLVDIDELKRHAQALVEARDYAERIVRTVRDPLVILDADLRVHQASEAFCNTFKLEPDEAVGRSIYELGNRQWDIPRLRRLLDDVLPTNNFFDAFEVTHDFKGVGRRTMMLNARTLGGTEGHPDRILLGIEDVTEQLRYQAEQYHSQIRYQALVQASAQIVWTTDASGTVVEDSPSWRAFTGQTYDQWKGLGWFDAFHPDDRERVAAAWERTVAARKPLEIEYRIRHVSGDWRWMNVRALPVQDADGNVREWVGMNTDITDHKAAEEALRESEERFRTLFEAAPMALFVCDREAVIQYYNRRAVELWGREPTRGVERYCGSIKLWLPDGTLLPHQGSPIVDVLRTGFPVRNVDVQIERPDGSRLPVLANFAPLTNAHGEITGAITSFVDVTDQKDTADALQRVSNELVDADRRKNEFLAMLAHELRNPLAPIRNALSILRRTTSDAGEPRQLAVDMMERQVGQLVRLVDDLLDVSRISHGHIELRRGRVELRSIVRHAVEAAQPIFDSMEHDLTVVLPPEPIYVDADAGRLAQVVGNLLSNACKFTDRRGRVDLRVERDGEQALIRVRDNGIGIATAQLHRIFDMFAQVDTSIERTTTGLGIGLSLVMQLVMMHGGTVEAHSGGIGRGSEFIVRLPISAAAPTEAEPPAPTVDDAARTGTGRILIVDDNRDAADSVATLLELAGNDVHTAYDGLEAIATAAAVQPDVMLLDIGLPKLNGYQVARRIRAEPWGKRIVLVALTGWGQDKDRQKSRDAGFDTHLVKPVDPDALLKLLNALPSTGERRQSDAT